MRIQLLFFAQLREERGCAEETFEIEPGMTPNALFLCLFGRPAIGIRFAINKQYTSGDDVLQPNDELAFLPPLGGG